MNLLCIHVTYVSYYICLHIFRFEEIFYTFYTNSVSKYNKKEKKYLSNSKLTSEKVISIKTRSQVKCL